MLDLEQLYSNLGPNCVALYKVSRLKGISLPAPPVHVYIGGILDRVDRSCSASPFVVRSVSELSEVINKHKSKSEPNAVPYLVAQASGDFYFNFYSRADTGRDLDSVASFYSAAHVFGSRLGRNMESLIFGLMINHVRQYSDFLKEFYKYLDCTPDFKVTLDDFVSLKEYINARASPQEKKLILGARIVVDDDKSVILN